MSIPTAGSVVQVAGYGYCLVVDAFPGSGEGVWILELKVIGDLGRGDGTQRVIYRGTDEVGR